MGRVSDAKDRLMDAVRELIWEGSYGSTTIDQICEKAGVKKGSFYYFFDSKTDLAIAALDAEWVVRRAELDSIFSPMVPPLERVRTRMRAEERVFELATEDPHPEHLAVAHSSTTDEAERWAERLRGTRPGVPVDVRWLGPVVGVYAGPNVLGMACVRRPTDEAESEDSGVE